MLASRYKLSQKGFTPVIMLAIVVIVIIGAAIYLNMEKFKSSAPIISTPFQTKPLTLEIESPNDQTVAIDNQVLIKGKTLPNTSVVIYNEVDEAVLESDGSGQFTGKLMLNTGVNTLTVSAFSDDGQEKSVNLDITYNES